MLGTYLNLLSLLTCGCVKKLKIRLLQKTLSAFLKQAITTTNTENQERTRVFTTIKIGFKMANWATFLKCTMTSAIRLQEAN